MAQEPENPGSVQTLTHRDMKRRNINGANRVFLTGLSDAVRKDTIAVSEDVANLASGSLCSATDDEPVT